MNYDLIILGGGPAGYLAAERAGHAGMKVACIEKEHLGGTCLNEGCIPIKTLLYSAKLYDGIRHGSSYGVTAENIRVDQRAVLQRKDKVVRTLVKGVGAALRTSKVEVISAEGKVLGRAGINFRVQAGEQVHEAPRLLIATGSETVIPPIPGLREGLKRGFVLTNRELLQLAEIPSRMIVIGGGVIGLEFASYFSSVGCQVTVVEMMDHIAGAGDEDLIAALQAVYEKRGINFVLGARVVGVGTDSVQYEKEGKVIVISADCVLLSIGRRARSTGFGLENIGILMEHGAVVTDEHMQTNVPNVYAAGDVNGKNMLAHVAYREAEVAINHMLNKRDIMRYRAVPSVVYTNPEFSSVGETESSAKRKGMDVAAIKLPMEYSGRYVAENDEGGGLCKLVICNQTRTIVGAQFLGNYSSEFLFALAAFIELELPLDDIKEIIFPHPTVCEIIKEAVCQYRHS